MKIVNYEVQLKKGDLDLTPFLQGFSLILKAGLNLPIAKFYIRKKFELDIQELINLDTQFTLLFLNKENLITYKFYPANLNFIPNRELYSVECVAYLKELLDSSVDYCDGTSVQAITKFASSLSPDVKANGVDNQVWIKTISLKYTLENIWLHSKLSNGYLVLALDDKLYGRSSIKPEIHLSTKKERTSLPLYIVGSDPIVELKTQGLLLAKGNTYQLDYPNWQTNFLTSQPETKYGITQPIRNQYGIDFSYIDTDNVHPNYNQAYLDNIQYLSSGIQLTFQTNFFVPEINLLTGVKLTGFNISLDGLYYLVGKEVLVDGSRVNTKLTLWRDALC